VVEDAGGRGGRAHLGEYNRYEREGSAGGAGFRVDRGRHTVGKADIGDRYLALLAPNPWAGARFRAFTYRRATGREVGIRYTINERVLVFMCFMPRHSRHCFKLRCRSNVPVPG
jgi:hypothetical protein